MSELVSSSDGVRVGEAIRRTRTDAGLTLRRLAERVGVSVGTMSAIENDKVALTVQRLHEIAEALGTTAAAMMRPESAAAASAPVEALDLATHTAAGQPRFDPVLTAAVEVFRTTGYHGATMRLIAQAADISVAGIYHHYRSKQSLLVALVDRVMAELSLRIRAASTADDPVARYHDMVRALALFHAECSDLAFIVATETRSLEDPDRARIAGIRRGLQAELDRTARQAADGGAFRTPHPERTSRAVATLCLALPYWYSPDGDQGPAEIADEYADLAFAMMQHHR